ncbi:MAG: cupin domain-containing protein [Halodesulfurarchaeum sp.]
MTHVSTTELLDRLEREDRVHLDVLDEESMTVEIGRYTEGNSEPKNPHTGDEIYYIVSGSGKARVGDDTYDVSTGDVVFVEEGLEHDFFDITEDITTLIVLAGSSDPAGYAMRE